MVTRSAPCEASETWHMRVRLAGHASSVMTINLTRARVNNNGREESAWGGEKKRRTVYRSRSLKAKS